jgi:hypothetical protein
MNAKFDEFLPITRGNRIAAASTLCDVRTQLTYEYACSLALKRVLLPR